MMSTGSTGPRVALYRRSVPTGPSIVVQAPLMGETRPGRPGRSDADALGQKLPVVGRVAEEELGRLGPLEVEVRVVLPGEPNAAVDLDVLRGSVEVRLGAIGL